MNTLLLSIPFSGNVKPTETHNTRSVVIENERWLTDFPQLHLHNTCWSGTITCKLLLYSGTGRDTIHVLCCNRIYSFRLLHIIIIWVDFWYHYKLDVMQQCIHFDLYENFINTSKSLVSNWRVCCVKLGKFSTDALLAMYWSRYKYIQIWYIELSDGSIVKFTTNWIMISIRINQI